MKLAALIAFAGLAAAQYSAPPPGEKNAFAQTSTVTIANSTAEASLIGTGAGSMTIPANTLAIGSTYRLKLYGIHSATANPSITIRVKLNGSTIISTPGPPLSNSSTNETIEIDVYLTCRTTGGSGSIFMQGTYMEWNAAGNNSFPMAATSATTIDTTAAITIDVTAQWGTQSLSDTISSTNVVLDQVR